MPTIDNQGNIYTIAFDTACCPYYECLVSLTYNGNFRWKYIFDDELNDDFWQPLIEKGFVSLIVYDMLGREAANLVNENQVAGQYTVMFKAVNLPSGVYIYSLRVNDFVQNNKMTLLK